MDRPVARPGVRRAARPPALRSALDRPLRVRPPAPRARSSVLATAQRSTTSAARAPSLPAPRAHAVLMNGSVQVGRQNRPQAPQSDGDADLDNCRHRQAPPRLMPIDP